MKLEVEEDDIRDFSIELAMALCEEFHIQKWVAVPRSGMEMEYVSELEVSDFIVKFIEEEL